MKPMTAAALRQALAVLAACAVLSRIGRGLKPYIDARAQLES